jgi:hypothetical protein
MTMTIPPQTEEINVVVLDGFYIDSDNKGIFITFRYGFKDVGGNVTKLKSQQLNLDETKYNQLLNATPPGNKTFKQWIRPLIYNQIASNLGVPPGQID